jgi:DNA-binding response OmpR family regulator
MAKPSLSDRAILIVQRQWVVTRSLASAFEAEGVRVLRANSADSGRSLVEQSDLACAVLDSESRELCRMLKSKGIPFVMYTGREVLDDECAGAPVIKKPATPREVVALVKRLL